MKQRIFYRNIRASQQLDIFLISAAASLLSVRSFLALTGYPQIGGNGLHIAHLLWGGLCMLISITIMLAFIGLRAQRVAALIGGVGFGVFIDEIGKFITSDNNYFFRPAVGIIYAIFIVLYLGFNFIGRKQRLTSQEYQLNAIAHLEEAIVHDMDSLEKRRAHELLARASRRSAVTTQLQLLLDSVELVPENQPGRFRRFVRKLDHSYEEIWKRRTASTIVRSFFIAEVVLFIVVIAGNLYANIDDITALLGGQVDYGAGLLVGQLVSSMVAAGYVIYGTIRLKFSRIEAFESFRRATLINLLLTEFFVFSRIEFEALPGFALNIIILLLITYVIHQESRANRHHSTRKTVKS